MEEKKNLKTIYLMPYKKKGYLLESKSRRFNQKLYIIKLKSKL